MGCSFLLLVFLHRVAAGAGAAGANHFLHQTKGLSVPGIHLHRFALARRCWCRELAIVSILNLPSFRFLICMPVFVYYCVCLLLQYLPITKLFRGTYYKKN